MNDKKVFWPYKMMWVFLWPTAWVFVVFFIFEKNHIPLSGFLGIILFLGVMCWINLYFCSFIAEAAIITGPSHCPPYRQKIPLTKIQLFENIRIFGFSHLVIRSALSPHQIYLPKFYFRHKDLEEIKRFLENPV